MLDILVTVGVILVLIALVALMLHLVNTHQGQRVATARYERFHPGDPRPGPSEEQAGEQGGALSSRARTRDEAVDEAQHPAPRTERTERGDPDKGPEASA